MSYPLHYLMFSTSFMTFPCASIITCYFFLNHKLGFFSFSYTGSSISLFISVLFTSVMLLDEPKQPVLIKYRPTSISSLAFLKRLQQLLVSVLVDPFGDDFSLLEKSYFSLFKCLIMLASRNLIQFSSPPDEFNA